MLDLMARTLGGPDAALNSQERNLLEGPIRRMLGRHTASAERIAALADPLALLLGLAMWGGRVMQIRAAAVAHPAPARAAAPGATPGPAQAAPPAPPGQATLSTEPLVTLTPAAGPLDLVGEAIDAAA